MSEQLYTTDTAAERLTRSVAEAVAVGGRFSRAEFSVDDVSTILELLQTRKVDRAEADRVRETQPVIQIPTPHNAIAQEVLICGANDWMIEDEAPHM